MSLLLVTAVTWHVIVNDVIFLSFICLEKAHDPLLVCRDQVDDDDYSL